MSEFIVVSEILSFGLSNEHKHTFRYEIGKDPFVLSLTDSIKKIKMCFFDVVFFKYELLTTADKLIELEGNTPLFKEIMKKHYDPHPVVYPYRHYQILDINGVPKIEIIALPLDVYLEQ